MYLNALAVRCWKIFLAYIKILPIFFYIPFYWATWNLRVCSVGPIRDSDMKLYAIFGDGE
jgi:hypothetical protein